MQPTFTSKNFHSHADSRIPGFHNKPKKLHFVCDFNPVRDCSELVCISPENLVLDKKKMWAVLLCIFLAKKKSAPRRRLFNFCVITELNCANITTWLRKKQMMYSYVWQMIPIIFSNCYMKVTCQLTVVYSFSQTDRKEYLTNDGAERIK